MAEYSSGMMIESEVRPDRAVGNTMVVYWHEDCFVDDPPYRKIVRWMLTIWRDRFDVALVGEPKEKKDEDFVVHDVLLGGRPLSVYWENSLGYISLQSKDEALIREAARLLKGRKPEI